MNKISPFGIVKPGRELEDLPAFLTFSQKQRTWHMRGVKELGRPFLTPYAAKFLEPLAQEGASQNA
ncbi:MAG: hypothetical protein ABSC01_11195 [Verrucomicrobiota bacterium]